MQHLHRKNQQNIFNKVKQKKNIIRHRSTPNPLIFKLIGHLAEYIKELSRSQAIPAAIP